MVIPILAKYAEEYIYDETFRTKLYEYLLEIPNEYRKVFKQYAIIPVYGQLAESVAFTTWKEDSIFVKKGAMASGLDYYKLNEKMLSKPACETIFEANINEMNESWERNRYNERLRRFVRTNNKEQVYSFLNSEYNKGQLRRPNTDEK